ncbi:MAG: class II fumarate hydratase [Alcanivorax sp.]|jgi:fumarate hydratase class II
MGQKYRTEHDSMGEVNVPENALYGAQTQRAVDNFSIAQQPMPEVFLRALVTVKLVSAITNGRTGELEADVAASIENAALSLLTDNHFTDHFPVDVFQTGSGTSSNMNVNEVLARMASLESGYTVSPNDHVNYGQSSNDVIPSAIHIASALEIHSKVVPALAHLKTVLAKKSEETHHIIKTGRTHLMDAMPVRFSQVISGWIAQVEHAESLLIYNQHQLQRLAIGGTAVGTGVNAPAGFAKDVCAELSKITGVVFSPADNRFAAMGAQDTVVATGAALKTLAVALMKIANDLRWMNSGPLAGLGEIELPALQPGSSIMPGKVNPVIPEAVAMACAQVIGNDTTITVAGQSGNFELNVMLPVMASKILDSTGLMARSAISLADQAIAGFTVKEDVIKEPLARNPVLVTALNPVIGYLKAAEIAKKAYKEGRAVIDVAEEMTEISRDELEILLDPARLV